MEETYFYVLYEYKQGVWTPVTRYNLTPSMIQGIYSAQIFHSGISRKVNKFAILSENQLPDQIGKLTYAEAYNFPLNNLNDYSIIESGKPIEIHFHRIRTRNSTRFQFDSDPFTKFIIQYTEEELNNAINNPANRIVKLVAHSHDDFVNGFLLYSELIYRYSEDEVSYPNFKIIDLNSNTEEGFRCIICNWLFGSLPLEIQKEITDYMPKQFMYVNKKYYKMYVAKLASISKASLKVRTKEICRRCRNNYPVDRIAELLVSNLDNEAISEILKESVHNPKFFKYFLQRYYGTIITKDDMINALSNIILFVDRKKDTTVNKEEVQNLILEILSDPRYVFGDEHVTLLFANAFESLAAVLFDTGMVDTHILYRHTVETYLTISDLSLGALKVLINHSDYDISAYADTMILTLISSYPREAELLTQLLNDPRVTSDHIYRTIIRYGDEELKKIRYIIPLVRNKFHIHENWVANLVKRLPNLVLPMLEVEGKLNNKEYTDTFVTPYINQTINDHLEELSRTSPNVIRYLLTIPRFNPSYNYNIVARTLAKNNHVQVLSELLRDDRVVLGTGTREVILENPLLRHLLDDSSK